MSQAFYVLRVTKNYKNFPHLFLHFTDINQNNSTFSLRLIKSKEIDYDFANKKSLLN